MTRCPEPSWKTFAVLVVIVSISPVPKTPVPVSYFQVPVFSPVPAAPVKSSLHVVVKPDGAAGTAAAASAGSARATIARRPQSRTTRPRGKGWGGCIGSPSSLGTEVGKEWGADLVFSA